jgi:TRAP-type C4-dicarboxylate transport system permease small subunit
MNQTTIFKRISGIVEKIIESVSIVMFVIIFIVAIGQIVMRWVFHSPLVWSEELIRLMFIWICYFGWAIATKSKTHIKITAVVSKLPPSGQRIIETFNILLTILFSLLMIIYGIELAKKTANGKAVTMPFISFAMVYAICPFSNCMIALDKVFELFDLWKPQPNKEVA